MAEQSEGPVTATGKVTLRPRRRGGANTGGPPPVTDPNQTRGQTSGTPNVHPLPVVVHVCTRTISDHQLQRARDKLRAVVARCLPRTSATIDFWDRYPSMSPTDGNRRLQAKLSAINEALGRGPMPALDPSRRGAADISFVAPYADGLAGLGALGDGGHTPNESLDLRSMPLAIKRAAILIYRLSKEH